MTTKNCHEISKALSSLLPPGLLSLTLWPRNIKCPWRESKPQYWKASHNIEKWATILVHFSVLLWVSGSPVLVAREAHLCHQTFFFSILVYLTAIDRKRSATTSPLYSKEHLDTVILYLPSKPLTLLSKIFHYFSHTIILFF